MVSAAVVLVVAGFALVLLQRSSLTTGIDQTLVQRADDIEALAAGGPVPDQLPPTAREGFAQIAGTDGHVVAATPNLVDAGSLGFDAGVTDVIVTAEVPEVDDDTFRVLTRSLEDGSVLHVGTTYDVVTESTAALIGSLALTIPLVLIVLGWLIWRLVGRTLRPVEAVRAEVSEIGATGLHRRVPTPGTRDEIDRLATTMNEMLERLEGSLQRQQRFVADASHELRSPLTRLRAQLELDMREIDDGGMEKLDSLHDEVVGMQQIVEDLLYLARADAGGNHLREEDIDLEDVVLDEAGRARAEGNMRVRTEGMSAARVTGDRIRLARAIRNLLGNAVRHAHGEVHLELTETGGWAVLRVSDDGPGVPAEAAEAIFERFSRPDESRTATTGGTGLGLAIAREIAEAHGGTVDLVNPGEPGATFEMRIPLRSAS